MDWVERLIATKNEFSKLCHIIMELFDFRMYVGNYHNCKCSCLPIHEHTDIGLMVNHNITNVLKFNGVLSV